MEAGELSSRFPSVLLNSHPSADPAPLLPHDWISAAVASMKFSFATCEGMVEPSSTPYSAISRRLPWDTETPWTLKDALAVARELERLKVYWMEEPLHRADRSAMRDLRQATSVRIAAGEMNRQLHEFRDLITDQCVDVLQPDVALVGGITGLRRIAAMAHAHGIVFTPHTWTNGMGVTANAHLAAGFADSPYLEFPFDPPEWGLQRRDFMMREPLTVDAQGWINLGDAPGMGYELEPAVLKRTRLV